MNHAAEPQTQSELPFREAALRSRSPLERVRNAIAEYSLAFHLTDLDGPAPRYEERGIGGMIPRSFGPRETTVPEALEIIERGEALAERSPLSKQAAIVLCARHTDEEIREFLDPDWAPFLERGLELPGLREAAAEYAEALIRGEPLFDLHDLDQDGGTSGAQNGVVVQPFGNELFERQWDRQSQSHGVQPEWIDEILKRKIRIGLIGDMGTGSVRQIKRLVDAGVRVIVTDHHAVDKADVAKPTYLLNPWLHPGYEDLKVYSASVVRRMFLESVVRQLRENSSAEVKGKADKIDTDHLDLLAGFGQLFDCESLTGGGRALVRRTLSLYEKSEWPGIAALRERFPTPSITAQHLAISIGSLLNSGQRLSSPVSNADEPSSLDAREIFTTRDPERAEELVSRDVPMNEKRKKIEQQNTRIVMDLISRAVRSGFPTNGAFAVADDRLFHGVAGLAAGRARDMTNRTVAVMAPSPGAGDLMKGSMRSGPGQDLSKVLADPRVSRLLLGWGAHPAAAGFSILRKNVRAFQRTFPQVMAEYFPSPPPQHITCDLKLTLSQFSRDQSSIRQLRSALEPCGRDNQAPHVLVGDLDYPVQVKSVRSQNGTHYSLRLRHGKEEIRAQQFHEIGRDGVFTPERPLPGRYALTPSESDFCFAAVPDWSYRYRESGGPVHPWLILESFQEIRDHSPPEGDRTSHRVFTEETPPPVPISEQAMEAKLHHPEPTLFDENFQVDLPRSLRGFENRFYHGRRILREGSFAPWADQAALAAYLFHRMESSDPQPVAHEIEKATGGGKTVAALLVLGEVLSKEEGRCLVLTRNSELCEQVKEEAEKLLTLPQGETAVVDGDTTKAQKIRILARNPRLLITTVHFAEANKIDPSEFERIFIDEGQNDKGDDPGAKFKRRTAELKPEDRPELFSLGGSIVSATRSYAERMELSQSDGAVIVEGSKTHKALQTVAVQASDTTRHRERLLFDEGRKIELELYQEITSPEAARHLNPHAKRLLKLLTAHAFKIEYPPPLGEELGAAQMTSKKKLMAMIDLVDQMRRRPPGKIPPHLEGRVGPGFEEHREKFKGRLLRTARLVKDTHRAKVGLLVERLLDSPAASGAEREIYSKFHTVLRQLDVIHRMREDLACHGRTRTLDYPVRLMWQALKPESKIAEPQKAGKDRWDELVHGAEPTKRSGGPYSPWAPSVRALRRGPVREVLLALSYQTPYRPVIERFYEYYNRRSNPQDRTKLRKGDGRATLEAAFPGASEGLPESEEPRRVARRFFQRAVHSLAESSVPDSDFEEQFFQSLELLRGKKVAIYTESLKVIEFLKRRIPHHFERTHRSSPPVMTYVGKGSSTKKERKENLLRFNREDEGILLTNQAFQEGHNISKLEQLIILGPFANFQVKEQLLGRLARAFGDRGYAVQFIVTGLMDGRRSPGELRTFAVNSSEGAAKKKRARTPRIVTSQQEESSLFSDSTPS